MRLLLLVLLLLPEVHGEKGKLHVAPQDDKDLKDVNRAGGKASIYISITVTYTHDKIMRSCLVQKRNNNILLTQYI